MEIEKLSQEVYNDLVQSYPEKKFPLEQSPNWGEFQSKIPGRQSLGTFLLRDSDHPVAIITPLQLTMRGYSYLWLNQGPIWLATPTPELITAIVKALQTIAKQYATQKILFVRAHFPSKPPKGLPAYSQALIQRTTVVDLTQNFDQILAAMSQGARRAMRKAAKAGVTIKELPAADVASDFAAYYAILNETAKRDGFFVHPASTYQSMLTSLPGIVRFFAAFIQDKPIAWAIDTTYNNHAIYYYGASNVEGRDLQAPYLLHIEIMRQLQEEGVKSYDFLGIGSKSYPGLQGVTQFKLRFGGDVVDYLPAYDIPLSPQYHPWKWAQAMKYKLRH